MGLRGLFFTSYMKTLNYRIYNDFALLMPERIKTTGCLNRDEQARHSFHSPIDRASMGLYRLKVFQLQKQSISPCFQYVRWPELLFGRCTTHASKQHQSLEGKRQVEVGRMKRPCFRGIRPQAFKIQNQTFYRLSLLCSNLHWELGLLFFFCFVLNQVPQGGATLLILWKHKKWPSCTAWCETGSKRTRWLKTFKIFWIRFPLNFIKIFFLF